MRRVQGLAREGRHQLQRGVSMLFALIAVVVLTLGAVALVRSVDTGAMVLGNLSFKQDSLAASSIATENAITWLQSQPAATLDAGDIPASGYYFTSRAALDITGRSVATAATNLVLVDWDGNGCAVSGLNGRTPVCVTPAAPVNAGGSNTVRYLITRLCEFVPATNPPLKDCAAPLVAATGESTQRGGLSYGGAVRFQTITSGAYYRIVTRTVGVRGTVSYAETLVHF